MWYLSVYSQLWEQCLWDLFKINCTVHCNEGKCHSVWLTDVVLIVFRQQWCSVALRNHLYKPVATQTVLVYRQKCVGLIFFIGLFKQIH